MGPGEGVGGGVNPSRRGHKGYIPTRLAPHSWRADPRVRQSAAPFLNLVRPSAAPFLNHLSPESCVESDEGNSESDESSDDEFDNSIFQAYLDGLDDTHRHGDLDGLVEEA